MDQLIARCDAAGVGLIAFLVTCLLQEWLVWNGRMIEKRGSNALDKYIDWLEEQAPDLKARLTDTQTDNLHALFARFDAGKHPQWCRSTHHDLLCAQMETAQ